MFSGLTFNPICIITNTSCIYIVLLVSICYCFMHNHAPFHLPTISPLLYHDSFSIIVYRFMYSIFCYLPSSLYYLISCEFIVFYNCLARVKYLFITTCHILTMANYNLLTHNIGLNENIFVTFTRNN